MNNFMPGDRVKYIGNKTLDIDSKVGEVVAHVGGEPDAVVVEFGSDSYIVHKNNLARHYFAAGAETNSYKARRADPDME